MTELSKSPDYKQRVIYEYTQLKGRLQSLTTLLEHRDQLSEPLPDVELLNVQQSVMTAYLNVLKLRLINQFADDESVVCLLTD